MFLCVKVIVYNDITTKKQMTKTSFAGRIFNEFVCGQMCWFGGGHCSVDPDFAEILVGAGQRRASGGATVFVAIIKVSLNLRGKTQLESSHSLFQ